MVLVVGLSPNPGALFEALAVQLTTTRVPGSPAPLIAAVLCFLLAFAAGRRLLPAVRGWLLHLPVSGPAHFRAFTVAVLAAQIPVLAAWLGLWLYGAASGIDVAGSRLALIPAAGLAATLSAATWSRVRLAHRKRATGQTGTPAPPALMPLWIAWRAAGPRLVQGFLAAALPLAALNLFLRNNDLAPSPAEGAGKSTLLRVAAGIEKPENGTVTINGLDLWDQEAAARAGLAFLPDHADLTPYATLAETLGMVCRVRCQPAGLAGERLEQVGLAMLSGRSIRELSFGQRRRAMLAAVMIGEPPVLLLDEPLDGMDAEMRLFILDWIQARLSAGAAILTASHEMDTFGPLADRAVGMKDGQVLASVDRPGQEALDHLARGVAPA